MFQFPKGTIQLKDCFEELNSSAMICQLVSTCMEACAYHKKRNLTFILSDLNIFYVPSQNEFKVVPIIDKDFKIFESAKTIIQKII